MDQIPVAEVEVTLGLNRLLSEEILELKKLKHTKRVVIKEHSPLWTWASELLVVLSALTVVAQADKDLGKPMFVAMVGMLKKMSMLNGCSTENLPGSQQTLSLVVVKILVELRAMTKRKAKSKKAAKVGYKSFLKLINTETVFLAEDFRRELTDLLP